MNSDPARVDSPAEPPSTAGMTTKAVKGSLWMVTGRVLMLAASLVSSPFVIRLLGAEKYGVLILVAIIPAYFGFADFGMSVASTTFAADAFAEGDPVKEANVIRAATGIALLSSLVVAVPLFIFSTEIVSLLNVPADLVGAASISLRITSAGFVFGLLASVVNSAQLARMRMDLTTAVTAGCTILMSLATPVVLYLGGGIVGAAWTAFIAAFLMALGHLLIGRRLLPQLFDLSITLELFRPLLKAGGAWLLAMVAGGLLVNVEKLFLTRLVSVQALAYYSVAFTFSSLATLFSSSLVQSLIPAFTRLRSANKMGDFEALFARGVRITMICMLPTITLLFVIARPFFTMWAGPDFGEYSTVPLYILLIGLQFSVIASIPYAAIVAAGRTSLAAKLLWIELIPHGVIVFFCISWFGIVGAAIAWSLRAVIEGIILIALARRVTLVSFGTWKELAKIGVACSILLPMILYAALFPGRYGAVMVLAPICMLGYSLFVWVALVDQDEKRWINSRISFFHRFGRVQT